MRLPNTSDIKKDGGAPVMEVRNIMVPPVLEKKKRIIIERINEPENKTGRANLIQKLKPGLPCKENTICVFRQFEAKAPWTHEVTIRKGKNLSLRKTMKIPGDIHPRFVTDEFYNEAWESTKAETKEDRIKQRKKDKETEERMLEEKDERVKEFNKILPPKEELSDIQLFLNTVKALPDEFYLEKARQMLIRETPDFQPFVHSVKSVKAQKVKLLQMGVTLTGKNDQYKALQKAINDRQQKMEEDHQSKIQQKQKLSAQKKRFSESLMCQISQAEMKKKPMQILAYEENAFKRQTSYIYHMTKAKKKRQDRTNFNRDERTDIRYLMDNNCFFERLDREIEAKEREKESIFEKMKEDYHMRFKEQKREEKMKKEQIIQEISKKNLERLNKEKLMEELAYIRDKDMEDYKWRKSEEKKIEGKLESKKELLADSKRLEDVKFNYMAYEMEKDHMLTRKILKENMEDYNKMLADEARKRSDNAILQQVLRNQIALNEKKTQMGLNLKQEESRLTNLKSITRGAVFRRNVKMELNRLR